MATTSPTVTRESRVLGLISTGHFMSHYSQVALYPLFPLMHEDLGISYVALGIFLAILNLSGAAAQIPIGFLVDRLGARKILIFGVFVKTFAIGSVALSNSYEMILLLAVVAGLGNSVFHPADYSILMSSIDGNRMGRAFSIHTASGSAGSFIAPAVVTFIAAFWDWRIAVFSVALLGAMTGIAMIFQANLLQDHVGRKKEEFESPPGVPSIMDGIRTLFRPNVLILYLFFMTTAMISIGLNSYIPAGLMELHNYSVWLAGITLSIFLGAGLVGVLFGGYLADRTTRHDLIAIVSFLVSGIFVIAIGSNKFPVPIAIAGFAIIGFCLGSIRPARDMMVRAITKQGDGGKMFGFMSNGHQLAGVIVPILFGWFIDQGSPQWIFWLSGIFMAVAILTLLNSNRK